MRPLLRLLAIPATAFALASCASPSKLARQSSDALANGDLHKAYDRALHAIEKDPQHQGARAAYAAASARVGLDYQMRVIALATADTMAAANLVLEFRQFRDEVVHHETALDTPPDYARAERAIVAGAARGFYQRGLDAMTSGRPRIAVDEFAAARRYDPNYSDVVARLDAARRAATVRVALLPLVDATGLPGLGQETGDTLQREVSRRVTGDLRFTRVVNAAEVENSMTVAEARNMRREDAMDVGRRVGADLVVMGRVRGLRSSGSERTTRLTIYHRVDHRDSTGVTSRWEALVLPVITRQRTITVIAELDVVDVNTGAVVAHRDRTAQTIARTAWTDYSAEEHYDRYALLPPDVRKTDAARAKLVDTRWKEQMGSWDLDDFMRRSRESRGRARYAPRYRGDFYDDSRDRPVWLGELPGDRDLAFVALRELWRDVMSALKELDEKN